MPVCARNAVTKAGAAGRTSHPAISGAPLRVPLPAPAARVARLAAHGCNAAGSGKTGDDMARYTSTASQAMSPTVAKVAQQTCTMPSHQWPLSRYRFRRVTWRLGFHGLCSAARGS